MQNLLLSAQDGFETLNVSSTHKQKALEYLKEWLTKEEFKEYVPQIEYLIHQGYWDYLLDSFYQIIPFGTGGRRGEVGIGPNRINYWTIKSSAQGHAQYLINEYHDEAKSKGVVLAYDVRQFFTNQYFNNNLPNPVKNLSSKDLALAAATVYSANGIKVYIFDDVRTTPELSFAIRHLGAIGGCMFSASHNPPDHNGKKVYDQYGGQLIPPYDEILVEEVTKRVRKIVDIDKDQAYDKNLIENIGKEVDDAYLEALKKLSQSSSRSIKIVYTPLHGCGATSVTKILKHLGFDITEDPKTSNPSGKFENVTFNIPNPEVEQSFSTPLAFAKETNADIILNSDPDADRIGLMVSHNGEWVFLNGNEIGVILTEYATQKKKSSLKGKGVIVKTLVTTDLLEKIAKVHNLEIIGDLLVGFKYIADVMNKLEKVGRIDDFLIGCEESHGYIAGNYVRDKDAAVAAIWLSELASELKDQGKTLVDYLNQIYARYGYYRNYLTEVRLLGAEGKAKIDTIQQSLRKNIVRKFGDFEVQSLDDYQTHKPFLSDTDFQAKNVLVFFFKPVEGTETIKVTVRPSGTEPKIKMYFEIGSTPFPIDHLEEIKTNIESILKNLEKEFMKQCYKFIDIEFPDRGFLLFWQLPLDSKLKYFEIEDDLAKLKDIADASERKEKLEAMLKFLGSNPIEKIDDAFKAKYNASITAYLDLQTQ